MILQKTQFAVTPRYWDIFGGQAPCALRCEVTYDAWERQPEWRLGDQGSVLEMKAWYIYIYYIYIYVTFYYSGNQSWLAGKSPIHRGFSH